MSIKNLFFDLDRTLWDFEKNSKNELMYLFNKYKLHQKGISLPKEFIKIYKNINEKCWEKYRKNLLSKQELRTERFELTLSFFGINDAILAHEIGEEYVNNSPYRTDLIFGTIELLDLLFPHYKLNIITNGFNEVQFIKIKQSKLGMYFKHIITSEAAGAKKPSSKIFNYALNITNSLIEESVMIGDDLNTDIKGAIDIGMKNIFFNPNEIKHNIDVWNEVSCLLEIKKILL